MIPWHCADEVLQDLALDLDERRDVLGILPGQVGQQSLEVEVHVALAGLGLQNVLIDLLYLLFLTPVTSHNILLLQLLPNSIPYRQDNVRRRKDAHRVGTAARGSIARLSRLPRHLQSNGGASGRVRRALSTRAGDRYRPTQRAPLPPGPAVPLAWEECRGHCNVRRGRAPGPPRLHRHGALGASALGDRVSRTSGGAVGRTRWYHRLRSQQLPQARHAFGGGEAPVV